MKRVIILMMIVLFVISVLGFGIGNKADESNKQQSKSDIVIKTYVLKYVQPKVVRETLRHYTEADSFDRNGKLFTVRIQKGRIPEFEKLLEKLDVEKKKILFRIFTVIASTEGKPSDVQNKDLQQVLTELQKVLSFKSFRLDGASALTVNDGQGYSQLLLSSHSPLILRINDISIKGARQGERSINFEFNLRQKADPFVMKDGNLVYETLIQSETSVKERGYLVAGVSKIGNGDSLVLVINAEIK